MVWYLDDRAVDEDSQVESAPERGGFERRSLHNIARRVRACSRTPDATLVSGDGSDGMPRWAAGCHAGGRALCELWLRTA
jgi:hypothetical protein